MLSCTRCLIEHLYPCRRITVLRDIHPMLFLEFSHEVLRNKLIQVARTKILISHAAKNLGTFGLELDDWEGGFRVSDAGKQNNALFVGRERSMPLACVLICDSTRFIDKSHVLEFGNAHTVKESCPVGQICVVGNGNNGHLDGLFLNFYGETSH